jgi:hypothetical protein
MAGDKYVFNNGGRYDEARAAQTSAGAANAGNIVGLNASGAVDSTMLPGVAFLAAAQTWAATQTFQIVNHGASSVATSGANGNSYTIGFFGSYWTGSAAASINWSLQHVVGAGSTPNAVLLFTAPSVAGSTGFVRFASNQPVNSGANTNSPILQLYGGYWTGSAAANDLWQMVVTVGAGTNPTSTLSITHTGTPGTATVTMPSLTLGTPLAVAQGGTASTTAAAARTALGVPTITKGQATLVGGTVTITNAAAATGMLVFLTHAGVSGQIGVLSVGTIVNGTSFVINSTSALDTSLVNWMIVA